MENTTNLPLAAEGYKSYRYRGAYGYIMIGANDDADALREAARSIEHEASIDRLEFWDGQKYQQVDA